MLGGPQVFRVRCRPGARKVRAWSATAGEVSPPWGSLVLTGAAVGYRWSDLVDASGVLDQLLLAIWVGMAAAITWNVEPRSDLRLVLVGLCGGGLIVEWWGTKHGALELLHRRTAAAVDPTRRGRRRRSPSSGVVRCSIDWSIRVLRARLARFASRTACCSRFRPLDAELPRAEPRAWEPPAWWWAS